MEYYMMGVNCNFGDKIKNDIFIGSKRSIKEVKSSIQWMKKGNFKEDYRCVKRESKSEFRCIHTKELFNIDLKDKGAYTIEAWNKFINQF